MKSLSTLVAVAAGALLLSAFLTTQSVHAQATSTGSAARGKQAFIKYGCYQCHGTVGQGNYGAGPAIAPHPMPYNNLLAYIRAPRGQMPPFDEHVLPTSDAQDIYAYLVSIPGPVAGAELPAPLRAVDFGNAGKPPQLTDAQARGKQLFAGACMKCHGADGASPVIGPALVNEKAKKNLDAVIAQIKNPAPPMPKLYPSPFSDQNVSDIAAYVETL